MTLSCSPLQTLSGFLVEYQQTFHFGTYQKLIAWLHSVWAVGRLLCVLNWLKQVEIGVTYEINSKKLNSHSAQVKAVERCRVGWRILWSRAKAWTELYISVGEHDSLLHSKEFSYMQNGVRVREEDLAVSGELRRLKQVFPFFLFGNTALFKNLKKFNSTFLTIYILTRFLSSVSLRCHPLCDMLSHREGLYLLPSSTSVVTSWPLWHVQF